MNAIKILSMGVLVANCLKIMNGGKGAENENAVEGAGGGRGAYVVISCFSFYLSSIQRSNDGFFFVSVLLVLTFVGVYADEGEMKQVFPRHVRV